MSRLSFSQPSTRPSVVRSARRRAYTLMEVLVASVILLMVGISATRSLGVINQRAATSRMRLNARAVVERCITRSLNAPFSASSEPFILGLTAEVRYDDSDDSTPAVTDPYDIPIMVQDTGGNSIVFAKLWRTVTAVSNAEGVDIRKVTFRIEYLSRGKPYTYSSTTVRAKG